MLVAVFDNSIAVRCQDGMALDAVVRIERRHTIAPRGRQLGVLVKLDCTVRQGFFSGTKYLVWRNLKAIFVQKC